MEETAERREDVPSPTPYFLWRREREMSFQKHDAIKNKY